MKILFCNVAYMKEYKGIREHDKPKNGGSYVAENDDCFEKNNFKEKDGYYYGSVETTKYYNKKKKKYENCELHIENIVDSDIGKMADEIEGVLVVFCAKRKKKETVIVGYYKDAIVYRKYKNNKYNIKSKHAHLIEEKNRNFVIQKLKNGRRGFGQKNVWYAKNSKKFVEEVVKYLKNNCGLKIKE